MKGYDWITQEMFDDKLYETLDFVTAASLVTIPGIYEILSEYYNNQIIEELEMERG